MRLRRIARARKNLAARTGEASTEPVRTPVIAHLPGIALSFVAHASLAVLVLSAPARAALPPSQVRLHVVERTRETPPVDHSAEAARETPPVRAPSKPPMRGPRKVERSPRTTQPTPELAPPLVGLTLESTAATGAVAFATGQTLAGETAALAQEPPAHAHPPTRELTAPPSRNRAARTRPDALVQVVPARRLAHVEPEYPPVLRARGIEADVTVRVELGADGAVLRSELVTAASDPAFDTAALLATKRERFAPETHDGRPVSTSLTYTYRFRIRP